MTRWMINCKEYSILVSEQMDRNLTFWERFSIRMHQMLCPPCNMLQKQLSAIRSACRASQVDDDPVDAEACRLPNEVRARIKSVIQDFSMKQHR